MEKEIEEKLKKKVVEVLIKKDLDIICKGCLTSAAFESQFDKSTCALKWHCLMIYNKGIENGQKYETDNNSVINILPKIDNGNFEEVLHFIINSFIEDNTLPIANTIGCCLSNYNDESLCRKEACKDRELCHIIKEREKQYYATKK